MRTQHRHDNRFSPLGEKFIALTARQEADNAFYIKLNIHNSDLEIEKEIYRCKRFSQPPDGDMNVVYDKGIIYQTCLDRIFVAAVAEGIIDVLNFKGEKLYSLDPPAEPVKVTEMHRKRYLDYYKAGPLKGQWERFEKQIKFPAVFPKVRFFNVADGKVYVLTYKKEGEKSEFMVFTLEGKLVKRVMVPLVEMEMAVDYYPYTIKGGKLYQLVENQDEKWDLEVNAID